MRRPPFGRTDDPAVDVSEFDYAAPAEIFVTRGGFTRSSAAMTYRRFPTAAAAIRFAIEEIPPSALLRATMEVRENRFDHRAIRALYDRSTPLPIRRKPGSAKRPPRSSTRTGEPRTGNGTL